MYYCYSLDISACNILLFVPKYLLKKKKSYHPSTSFSSAPSSSPAGVVVQTFNATAFNVSWRPPPRSERNGLVIAYEVNYGSRRRRRKSIRNSIVNTTAEFVLLLDLAPCTQYTVTVRAYTGAGPGPYSGPVTKFSSGWLCCLTGS